MYLPHTPHSYPHALTRTPPHRCASAPQGFHQRIANDLAAHKDLRGSGVVARSGAGPAPTAPYSIVTTSGMQSGWVGASILASLPNVQTTATTIAQWKEEGASAVHKLLCV